MWADKALALIKQLGVWGIGGSDGCDCAHFHIQGVSVDVFCHKSEHCVRVHSAYLYRNPMALEPIAAEVLRQLAEFKDSASYRIRFCDYERDHHTGKRESFKCCYCGKDRREREAYLCDDCKSKPAARELFPWTKDGFLEVGPGAESVRGVCEDPAFPAPALDQTRTR